MGCTVAFAGKEQVGLLSPQGVLFWVDLSSRREFAGMGLAEGTCWHVYFAQENSTVVSIVPDQGENELPEIGPVEVDAK